MAFKSPTNKNKHNYSTVKKSRVLRALPFGCFFTHFKYSNWRFECFLFLKLLNNDPRIVLAQEIHQSQGTSIVSTQNTQLGKEPICKQMPKNNSLTSLKSVGILHQQSDSQLAQNLEYICDLCSESLKNLRKFDKWRTRSCRPKNCLEQMNGIWKSRS